MDEAGKNGRSKAFSVIMVTTFIDLYTGMIALGDQRVYHLGLGDQAKRAVKGEKL